MSVSVATLAHFELTKRERRKAVKIRRENMNEYSCVKKRHRQDKTIK
jgi:hypothetical protein